VRKALLVTAALVAAVFVWIVATLPPRPATASDFPANATQRIVAGAVHIHSTRSDGVGDREAIAAAAASAGLRFIAITDHGDATRTPDPPAYIHGVLCLDGVEISTNGGHYLALDMPAAPYPLGGEPAAVAEDVKRLGGFGVAAHPDSAKPLLRWTDWAVPIDGIEWLNLDSEWRDESRGRLARAVFDSLFRKGPALASVLDRPVATLDHWDALTARRPVVGLAGHDAHGGWSQRVEDGERRGLPGLPSYEASFRTFAIRAVLDDELSGDAGRDARLVFRALRAGRLFTAVDAIAAPAWVDLRSTSRAGIVEMGQQGPYVEGGELSARATLPRGGLITLLRNGKALVQVGSNELKATPSGPGAYRVEVSAPRAPGTPPVPWIVTNPIYLTAGPTPVDAPDPPVTPIADVNDHGVVEKDRLSTASLTSDGRRWGFEYHLGEGSRAGQYAALAISIQPSHPAFNALTFTASAPRAMRVSVQVRYGIGGGVRWVRSIYLAPGAQTISLPLERFLPVETTDPRPSSSLVQTILFSVDLVNATPNSTGQFEIANLKLGTVGR